MSEEADTESLPEVPVYEIPPDAVANFVNYQMLQFYQTEDGVEIGIAQVPVPKGLIEQFQANFGEEMAKENLRLVVHKGKAFLAPVKTTSLIGFE